LARNGVRTALQFAKLEPLHTAAIVDVLVDIMEAPGATITFLEFHLNRDFSSTLLERDIVALLESLISGVELEVEIVGCGEVEKFPEVFDSLFDSNNANGSLWGFVNERTLRSSGGQRSKPHEGDGEEMGELHSDG
jgi:hypothetical protein